MNKGQITKRGHKKLGGGRSFQRGMGKTTEQSGRGTLGMKGSVRRGGREMGDESRKNQPSEYE